MSTKEDCTECHGSGKIHGDPEDITDETTVHSCGYCGGTGKDGGGPTLKQPVMPVDKWVVQTMQNLTACDTMHTARGSTQRLLSEDVFDSETEAEVFYKKQRAVFRFASLAGQYVTFPRFVQNYEPAVIYERFCEHCGDGIEPENDSYIEIHGQDFCSKSCLTAPIRSPEEDGERYYEDY